MTSTMENWVVSGNLTINSYFAFINWRNGIFSHESGTLTVGGQIIGINGFANSSTFSMAAGSGDGILVLQGRRSY